MNFPAKGNSSISTTRSLFVLFAFVIGGCNRAVPPAALPESSSAAARGSAAPANAGKMEQLQASRTPTKLNSLHLPNAYRLHEKVISGGQPDGEAAFRELQKLGVKTVITVDGARPDVALAKKFGLRYIHLPHGYDGIGEQRVHELAKAVRESPGVVYIHCHHGKHRSPVAATVACVSLGLLRPSESLGILKAAGTSENYRGLYQSALSARQLDSSLLDALQVKLPEIAKLPPLAEAMVGIEHTHDRLRMMAANQWRGLPKHPDLTAPHEALLLRESFTELLRTEEARRAPDEYQQRIRDSESAALELEQALIDLDRSPTESENSSRASAAFERITTNCTACHAKFRDIPLNERQSNP